MGETGARLPELVDRGRDIALRRLSRRHRTDGGSEDVEAALTAAEAGAARWRSTPAHARMKILLRAAELADQRAGDIARTISAKAGKTITEATREASRSGEIIRLAAFEGTQLYGDTLPLDANQGTG